MSRLGGQSEARPSVFKSTSKLGSHLSTHCTIVKSVLKRIVNAEDENKRLEMEESLDELITNVQFANDECDFGMGLELGIDLFAFGDPYFHSHIRSILPLAYKLLHRPKYAEVIEFHLRNRKKSGDLNVLD
ncbi:histone PARylation factor 1 [Trichonephila clavipes]|nr:histone PARylation factor 1 [Trichonephila clavipes]